MKLLPLAVLAILFSTPCVNVVAQSDLRTKTYVGFGGHTCNDWRHAEAGYGRNAEAVAVAQGAWIWGFASGFNVGRLDVEPDLLQGKDAKYLVRWVGSYCDKNEQHTLWQASTALVRHLRGQE